MSQTGKLLFSIADRITPNIDEGGGGLHLGKQRL